MKLRRLTVPSSLDGPTYHIVEGSKRRCAAQQSLRPTARFGSILSALAEAHDDAVQMIDTSIVRVHQHGACMTRNRRQSMGRSRGGLTSKIHALVDTNGLPVRLALTAGEAHDNRLAGRLLSRLRSGAMLLAHRGYDADWIRTLATQKGAWANIPQRSNRNDPICFSPYLYRARNRVERFFNKIKHCRRVATRYDKLAANYLAFVQLAQSGCGSALMSPRTNTTLADFFGRGIPKSLFL
jgi:transposase